MNGDESYILKPRDPSAIVKLQDPAVIEQLLEQPLTVISEVITGFFASGNGYWATAGCKLAQAALKGRVFEQFAREFKELRDKGAIPEDFAEKKYGYQSWVELLTILDGDLPDEDRLSALKAMFFSVNRVGVTDAQRILNYQLFQIAKQLSSGELLLFKAANELYRSGEPTRFANKGSAERLSERLGHGVRTIVLTDLRNLVHFGLVSHGNVSTNRDVLVEPMGVTVTDLGQRFYDNLRSYEIETLTQETRP